MDLQTLKKALNNYSSVKEALEDLRLIWKNCLFFNAEGSDIAKTAIAVGKDSEKIIEVSLKILFFI